jgi:hypothetical protein
MMRIMRCMFLHRTKQPQSTIEILQTYIQTIDQKMSNLRKY